MFRRAPIKSQSNISQKDLDEMHQLFQHIADSSVILFKAKAESTKEPCAVKKLGEILLLWTQTVIAPWLVTKNVDKTQFAINANAEMDLFYKKRRRVTRGWVQWSPYRSSVTHNNSEKTWDLS